MQKLKTEKVPKEYLYSAKMKMNLQRRNNLSTRERFQGSYARGCLVLLGISDEFLFCNNFNDHKMHFIGTRNISPHSRESFPCRVTFILHEQRYPFGKKILEFDCQVQFGFLLRIFLKQQASCVYLAMIQEIPQQAR